MRKLTIEPGRPLYLCADLHVGHAAIVSRYGRTWAADPAAHDEAVVAGLNARAGADAVLVVAGDVGWNKAAAAWLRDRLLARTVLVTPGNHDDDADLRAVFGADRVAERVRLKAMTAGGWRRAVVEHYPGDSWWGWDAGWALMHGHQHARDPWARAQTNPKWSLSVDVGLDGHANTPWEWGELWQQLDRRTPRLQQYLRDCRDEDREGRPPGGRGDCQAGLPAHPGAGLPDAQGGRVDRPPADGRGVPAV